MSAIDKSLGLHFARPGSIIGGVEFLEIRTCKRHSNGGNLKRI